MSNFAEQQPRFSTIYKQNIRGVVGYPTPPVRGLNNVTFHIQSKKTSCTRSSSFVSLRLFCLTSYRYMQVTNAKTAKKVSKNLLTVTNNEDYTTNLQ